MIMCVLSRHWKELMDKTGQKFEMNPDTCTLQNIFAMELHRFQDKIAEIVNCAIKELAIEKVTVVIYIACLLQQRFILCWQIV